MGLWFGLSSVGHGDQGKVSSSLNKTGIPSRYATLCLAMITGWTEKAEKSQGGKMRCFVSDLGEGVWAWTLGVLESQKDDTGTQHRHGVLFLCLAAPSTRSMPGAGGLFGARLRQRMPQTLWDHGGYEGLASICSSACSGPLPASVSLCFLPYLTPS